MRRPKPSNRIVRANPDQIGTCCNSVAGTHPGRCVRYVRQYRPALILGLLLAAYATLECFVPLGTAVQIGADEGFNLAKATLCLKGFKLYSEVWNDQPPLHTFLITQLLDHTSGSVLGPRLLTVGFAATLLASLFMLALRVSGLPTAALTTALVIASPGFVELSSSCMLEIPALATGVSALCILMAAPDTKYHVREALAGVFFGAAVQIKLAPAILLPLAAFLTTLHYIKLPAPGRSMVISLLVFCASLLAAWAATGFAIDRFA